MKVPAEMDKEGAEFRVNYFKAQKVKKEEERKQYNYLSKEYKRLTVYISILKKRIQTWEEIRDNLPK